MKKQLRRSRHAVKSESMSRIKKERSIHSHNTASEVIQKLKPWLRDQLSQIPNLYPRDVAPISAPEFKDNPAEIGDTRTSQEMPLRLISEDLKQMRILVISLLPETMWRTLECIKEYLRYFVDEVIDFGLLPSLATRLQQLQPDIVLLIGESRQLADDDVAALCDSCIPVVVWLDDAQGISEQSIRLVQLSACAFTQSKDHAARYREMGIQPIYYLPFAADLKFYYPKEVSERYRSALLIVGDIEDHLVVYAEAMEEILHSQRVFAVGKGWEKYSFIRTLRAVHDEELSSYYNGADLVVHLDSRQCPRRLFEIAACGAFQVVQDQYHLYEYMSPGKHIVTFQSIRELQDVLSYYKAYPDLKRRISTGALDGSRYNYSYVQIILRLLQRLIISRPNDRRGDS